MLSSWVKVLELESVRGKRPQRRARPNHGSGEKQGNGALGVDGSLDLDAFVYHHR